VANAGPVSVSDARGTVSVVSARTGTVTSTIRVGRAAASVAANWKTGRANVVNSASGTVLQSGTVSALAPCRA
jgi:DNA-binding beta-propeller fold protein YncE